ncbi:MAG: antirestriction protein ArdA [Pseudomonadota bacterium]
MRPRIYAACLAAYNNGILHGRWIDAAQSPDAIRADIAAMLAASPIERAEEWAIHDYEGFEGAPLQEYSGVETAHKLAAFVIEHGRLGGQVLAHFCGALDEAEAALENYAGEYPSLADFAQELTEDTGTQIPESLAPYIDYAAMGRDMDLSGDIFTITESFEAVHIFWTPR